MTVLNRPAAALGAVGIGTHGAVANVTDKAIMAGALDHPMAPRTRHRRPIGLRKCGVG
ncbi:hypothetical protein [Paracoccus sp. Ld10]|uniref:hypothetical protein n=1 Tax=Paracoccus sp. Ld10 TaxID=649158 RepID=UPI00386F8CC5